jgi:4-amino-4-deoxy-L-arabinose transferase-like glycosyltransferase/cytochrome c-type biogenesis protein CcmH/NrfG
MMEQPTAKRRLSTEWVVVLCVLGAALLYKLVYLTFYAQQMPYYTFPLGDSAIYLDWAYRILGGDFWGLGETFRVFYRAPLYPYLLAISLKIFGATLLPVYIVQFLLATFNLFLTYVIARRLFSHRAGLIAIILAALYAPLTFKESKLVSVTLVITLLLVAAWLLITAMENRVQPRFSENRKVAQPLVQSPPRLRWFLAGIAFGLATIAWGGAIVVVPLVIVLWLFLRQPRPAFKLVLMLVLGWFLMVLPVTMHNVLVGNDLVLVNSNNGYTFYQGNNSGAAGTIVHPPEVYEQAYGGRFPTGIGEQQAFDLGYASNKLYPAQQGQPRQVAKPSEASAFWMKRGLSWIAKHPGDFVRLEFQKLVLALSNYEFAGNYYLSVELNRVPVLRLLFMPFALLFALGIVGIFFAATRTGDAQSRFRETWPLHLIIVATVLTLLVFYVGSRYRLPLILPLAAFAGAGTDWIIKRFRQRRTPWPELGTTLFALILSAVFCGVPLRSRYDFVTALGYRNLGENYLTQAGDPARAIRALDQGLAGFDAYADFGHTVLSMNAHSDLLTLRGTAFMSLQKYDSAIADFRSALKADPRTTDPLSKLAHAYYVKAASQADATHPPARPPLDTALQFVQQWRQNDSMGVAPNALLGDICVARGDTGSALDAYNCVLRLDTLNVAAYLGSGDLYMGKGDTAQALALYQRAARCDTFSLLPALKLGFAYGVSGDHANVRKTLGAAADRVERNPQALQAVLRSQAFSSYIDIKYYLGIAGLNLGEWELAASQAQAILKLIPDNKAAQQMLQNAHDHVKPGKQQ